MISFTVTAFAENLSEQGNMISTNISIQLGCYFPSIRWVKKEAVQTFNFDSRGLTQVYHLGLRNYNHLYTHLHAVKGAGNSIWLYS